MLLGQAGLALSLGLSGARPGFWAVAGPLLLAGLGNGLVIAPNQDFVLAAVPPGQAGTAGGALTTAQRLGAAIGIAAAALACSFGLPRRPSDARGPAAEGGRAGESADAGESAGAGVTSSTSGALHRPGSRTR